LLLLVVVAVVVVASSLTHSLLLTYSLTHTQ
jgi:hypothetical protein